MIATPTFYKLVYKQNQVQNVLPEDLQDKSALQFRDILREGRTRVGIAAFSFIVTNLFLTSDNNTGTNNVVCAWMEKDEW